jgi:hypothetical protein
MACALMNHALSVPVMDQLLMEEDDQWLSHEEDDYLLNSSFPFWGVPMINWQCCFDILAIVLILFVNGRI